MCAQKLQPLAPPVAPELYRAEVEKLQDKILFESGDCRMYLVKASEAPNLLKELYRLREETFRAVGEGTGLPLDTDEYDNFYRHMILWNVPNGEIVGAYRLGFGPELLREHGGIAGFYTSTLFAYKPAVEPLLAKSMELGRSFVVSKYQREIFPLKFLLAGLAASTLRCPEIEYFMGPVSMSDSMPTYYQTLAVHFLMRDFAFPNAEEIVLPTTPFVPDPACKNPDEILAGVPAGDIDAFDHELYRLSDNQYRLPVLFRKYFSCSARVTCFNVDPLFSNSLDGLIFLRHSDYPQKTLNSLMRCVRPEDRDEIWKHFYGVPYGE